jgi:HSP20 family protein
MDRLFDSFFGLPALGDRWTGFSGDWSVPLDVEETDHEILVRAEIPGIKPDDLQLSIHGNELVISGEKKEDQERKESGYVYQERRYGSFRRVITLPTAVDEDNVKAEYKDGVLHIKMKKSHDSLTNKIK